MVHFAVAFPSHYEDEFHEDYNVGGGGPGLGNADHRSEEDRSNHRERRLCSVTVSVR
jgi:hypothetical protein